MATENFDLPAKYTPPEFIYAQFRLGGDAVSPTRRQRGCFLHFAWRQQTIIVISLNSNHCRNIKARRNHIAECMTPSTDDVSLEPLYKPDGFLPDAERGGRAGRLGLPLTMARQCRHQQ